MKPENTSRRFLKITQSWAKMFEYSVPPEDRIEVSINPAQLFELTIGILGDAAARTSRTDNAFEDDESKNLQFSARFFNAYLEGRFREDDDAYLLLLASAAFYLSHVPGSSIVLARRLAVGTPDIDGGGLEGLLHWLLLGARESLPAEVNSPFSKELQETALTLAGYYRGEVAPEVCMSAASALRARAYANGSPRQLLLADICAAVLRVKIRNSAQRCLPLYSKLALSDWKESLGKKGFLRELWPSQHLLGEKGIFSGVSAIVQMPTSAGKTHATELVIRSAFLRASVPDATRRAVFAQTLQGVKANLALETWAAENVDALTQTEAQEDLLRILWPVVAEGIENSTFRRIDTPETMLEAAQSWISGTSFGTILEELAIGGVRLLWGERRRNLTVEHVVEICEGAFGYDAALRIGAIADLLAAQSSADDERQALIHRLGELHKRLKYGLPRSSAVAFYECGFSDRVVAQHLANIVGRLPITRSGAIERLRESQLAAWTSLAAYPKYFQTRLEGLVA